MAAGTLAVSDPVGNLQHLLDHRQRNDSLNCGMQPNVTRYFIKD